MTDEYNEFLIPTGYIDWISKTKIAKLPKLSKTSNPATRKYNYEITYKDIRALEDFLFRWEFVFPEYIFDWSLNFEYNFLIDLTLNFDLTLDSFYGDSFWEFFNNFDFYYEYMAPAKFGITKYGLSCFDIGSGMKAIFGSSKYGRSYIDPPNIKPEDLLKFLRELRKVFTDSLGYNVRFVDEAMKNAINSNTSILLNEGVYKAIIDYMIAKLCVAEAKLRYNSYVDFAIVGFSQVLPPSTDKTGVGISVIRNTETYEPDQFMENVGLFDTVVGYAYVGLSRVGISREDFYAEWGADRNLPTIPPDLREEYLNTLYMGRNMLGVVDVVYQGKQLPHLPARRRLLMKGEEIALKGGVHQAIMQSYIQKVKQILDREGVVGTHRLNYISFANEVLYLRYEGNRKNKTWKRNISIDSLVEKYITLGAKEDILWKVVKICQRQ